MIVDGEYRGEDGARGNRGKVVIMMMMVGFEISANNPRDVLC